MLESKDSSSSVALATPTSPIQECPFEILEEIFKSTMDLGHTRKIGSCEVPVAPWRLSSVCSRWRAVAHASPRLWTNVCIQVFSFDANGSMHNGPGFESLSITYPLDALEEQLSLSKDAPLSIDLSARERQDSYLDQLLLRLINESHRWESLSIRWRDSARSFDTLATIGGGLPRLQRLVIHPYSAVCGKWPTVLNSLFTNAPSLREVFLCDEDFYSHSPRLQLPWHQLRRLRMRESLEWICDVLSRTTELVDCEIATYVYKSDSISREEEDEEDNQILVDYVNLPRLRRLGLRRWKPEGSKFIEKYLITSSLSNLEFQGHLAEIPPILKNATCPLQTLKLSQFIITRPFSLVQLLQQAPALSHLEIDWNSKYHYSCNAIDEFIDCILAMNNVLLSGNFVVLPKLVSIRLALPYNCELEHAEGPVCQMVESRWNRPAARRTLRSAHISGMGFHPHILARFEELRLEGLEINELREFEPYEEPPHKPRKRKASSHSS
ncbi:hypothetical protein R3P38DRAFT_1189520 [Favolaschia claudopus]|uniref:F-box domain-containing protein n=1 Tax=Favolaschia claudopus TaxID=2862362 RepID=A0AAW0E296_9AGAR